MKRAFVTGGSGFVGGRIVEALVARGIAVAALARSDRSMQAVAALGATAVSGDLVATDRDAISAAMSGCEVVFHSAALVEITREIPRWLAKAVAG